jgi:hypothetical protein
LKTARYGQLQPSTKTKVQVIKKQMKTYITITITIMKHGKSEKNI